MNQTILKLKTLTSVTALSRSSIYRLIQAGLFPKPVRLGLRSVGWRSEDVHAWLESRATVGAGA